MMEPVKAIAHGVPGGGLVVVWMLTHEHEVGEAQSVSAYRPCAIQVTGTFDGGSVAVQGSNDYKVPVAWFPLHDPLGDVLEITEESLRSIRESPVWIRVCAAGGQAKMAVQGQLFVQQP
jgi:hypothetical protein